jgi:hypothetical protein
MGPDEWGTRFEPLHLDGSPYAVDELPLSRALSERLRGEPLKVSR